ncbi:MAG: hypothetical protein EBS76_10560, partial [Actinobacteria bacterium]|nr:hypothetical protein [Actinomycetota bacterium]
VAIEEVVVETQPPPPEPEVPPDNPPEVGDDDVVITSLSQVDVTDQVLANDSDPDANQILTITAVTGVRAGGGEVVDGRLVITPDESLLTPLAEGETATETLTYTVKSGDLTETGTLTLTYLGSNDVPEIATYAIEVNQSDEGFTITPEQLLAGSSDADQTDALSVENVTLSLGDGAGIAVNNDGSLVVDPSAYAGLAENERGVIEYQFEVVERDDEGLELSRTSTTASITIIGVNDAPLVTGVESTATEDDAAYVINLLSDSVDVDASNALVIENLVLSSGDASGVTDNGDGTLLVDPGAYESLAANESSIVNYAFEVVEQDADGVELSRTGSTASITITGANDAVAVEAITSTASEDDGAYIVDLLANSADLDTSDQLSIENLTLASGEAASVTENADGTLLIDPGGYTALAAGETSVIVYEYDVVERDAAGTELSRVSTRATITMTGANDAPLVGAVNLETSEDDAQYLVSAETLLAASSDVDVTNTLVIESVAYVAGDDSGVTIEADGSLSVAPAS